MRGRLRIKLSEPLSAVFRAGDREGRGFVQDVSLGGLFLNSPMLLPSGTQLRANLTTASGWSFSVQGIVRWNTNVATCQRDESGFGIRLTRHSEPFSSFVDGAFAVLGPAPGEDWD